MTILDEIIAYKRAEVSRAKREAPLSDLESLARDQSPPRGFLRALRNTPENRFALIGEIKKASPSKGLIRDDFSPPDLASAYARGGAACLSVLTDAPSFQGAPGYMKSARAACALPVLRKDFMIDPYQIAEARAWGADCILLIMACLDASLAAELEDAAISHEMDVLVECHDAQEVEAALHLRSQMIGINNRNLKTFETTLQTTIELVEHVPNDRLVVSESGFSSHEDLRRVHSHGAGAFLIGESIMRKSDIESTVRSLISR